MSTDIGLAAASGARLRFRGETPAGVDDVQLTLAALDDAYRRLYRFNVVLRLVHAASQAAPAPQKGKTFAAHQLARELQETLQTIATVQSTAEIEDMEPERVLMLMQLLARGTGRRVRLGTATADFARLWSNELRTSGLKLEAVVLQSPGFWE